MKTIIIFFFLLVPGLTALAQTIGWAPIGKGNRWFYEDDRNYSSYELINVIQIIDSIQYNILVNKKFNTRRYIRLREDGYYVERGDSYSTEPNSEHIYYKKNAMLGDSWNYSYALVTDTFAINIFDTLVLAKNVHIDIGLIIQDQLWTEEFGLVATHESEGGSVEYLKGCIINGIVYGDTTTTPIEYEPIINLPDKIELSQNYPNPFNPSTNIEYILPEEGNINLTVYNLLGEKIAVLVNEYQRSGKYKVQFNSEEIQNIPSGIYFYRLITGSAVKTKKMVVVH